MTTPPTPRSTASRRGRLVGLAAGATLLAGLAAPAAATPTSVPPGGSFAESSSGAAMTLAAAPACGGAKGDYQKQVKQIRSILTKAAASSKAGKSRAAAKQLRTVAAHVPTAHRSAAAQIGLPPTDPESDDPPGPTAIAAVFNVDHRIVTLAVPLFAKLPARPSRALSKALVLTVTCRVGVARTVTALPPEGALDDYADSMADTLPTFKQELTAITAALGSAQLAAPGRAGLTQAQTTVKATQKVMNKAFGGGERPTS